MLRLIRLWDYFKVGVLKRTGIRAPDLMDHMDFKNKGLEALEDGICPYCGDALTIENISADHALPIHLGGSSRIHNILFVCYDCNIEKAAMPIDEYVESDPATRIGNRIQHDWSYRKRQRRSA